MTFSVAQAYSHFLQSTVGKGGGSPAKAGLDYCCIHKME